MTERLLTPDQVADRLCISRLTVMRYLRTGRLRSVKVGRLWRVRERDLEAFLQPPEHQITEGARLRVQAARDGKGEQVPTANDRTWLESDLSRLEELEPYDWGPGGPPKGGPLRYRAGTGVVIVDEGQQDG